MTGYVRQSTADIAAGEVVRAAPVNAEFNRLEQAFNAGTGHAHDGSSGSAPKINLTSSVTGALPIANGGTGGATAAAAKAALDLEVGVDLQAFDADLTAIAGLATTGLVVRTGAGTATTRAVTGTAAEITVTDGDGVAGAPTISLPAAMTMTGKTLTNGTYVNATLTSPTISNITISSGSIAGTHTGDGSGLTNLNASNLASGTITAARHGNLTGGNLHAVVDGSNNGFMSVADKTKLDGITSGAGPTTLSAVLAALNTQTLDTTPDLAEEIYSNNSKFSLTNLQSAFQTTFDARYYQPTTTATGQFVTSSPFGYRVTTGGTSAFWYYDNSNYYLMFSDSATGSYNSRRALYAGKASGLNSDTTFTAAGRIQSSTDLLSAGNVYSGNGASLLATNGDVYGSAYGGYLTTWVEGRCAAHQNAAVNRSVSSSRMAGFVQPTCNAGSTSAIQEFSGYVMTGMGGAAGTGGLKWAARQPQLYIANSGWFAAFPF